MSIDNNKAVLKRNSWLAINSLGLAILGIVLFVLTIPLDIFKGFEISEITLLFSLSLSVIALIIIKTKSNTLKGSGFAIIAILLVVPSFFFVDVFRTLPKRRAMREKANKASYNMKQLYNSFTKYCQDNNGYLPVSDKWCDLLMQTDNSITRATFKHPQIEKWECNIAFNKNLSGLKLSDVPVDTILFFEADGNWNLTGTADLLWQRRRKFNKQCFFSSILLVNGSIKTYGFARRELIRFDPNTRAKIIIK